MPFEALHNMYIGVKHELHQKLLLSCDNKVVVAPYPADLSGSISKPSSSTPISSSFVVFNFSLSMILITPTITMKPKISAVPEIDHMLISS